MGIIKITDDGIMQVDYDTGTPLPNESYILAAPAGGLWTLLADGGTGLVTLTDGAAPPAQTPTFTSPNGTLWQFAVNDAGTLYVVDFTVGKRMISPVGNDQVKKADGTIAVGYRIQTLYAGTTTPAPTFTHRLNLTFQPNPILLNSLGLPPQPIFIEIGVFYDFVLLDTTNAEVYRWTSIDVGKDATLLDPEEWIIGGEPATFVSPDTLALPGDKRFNYHVGRRLRMTVTAGTIYGTIAASVFSGTATTLTMLMDTLPLTNPIGAVDYGRLTATQCSVPDRKTLGLDTTFVGPVTVKPEQPFNLLPPGIVATFGTTIPPRWLLCAGASFLTADYPELFKALGYRYGGAGANFNVPDLRGRLPLGKDDMGGVAAGRVTAASVGGANAVVLGGAGGLETHALTLAENAPHTHGYSILGGDFLKEVGSPQVPAVNAKQTLSTGSDGSSAPHSNTPPWLAMNKAIWAGATYILEPLAFSDGFSIAYY